MEGHPIKVELELLMERLCADGQLSADAAPFVLERCLQIVTAAAELLGNTPQALSWFRSHPVSTFDSKTVQQLVLEGRADAVLAYLESLQSGSGG